MLNIRKMFFSLDCCRKIKDHTHNLILDKKIIINKKINKDNNPTELLFIIV